MTSAMSNPIQDSRHTMTAFFKKFFFQVAIIIIVIQLSVAASWAWTWMLFWNQLFGYIFIKIATVIGSGLLSGLISRVILKDHLRIMGWLSAEISVIFSLVGISFFTQNLVGFRLTLIPQPITNWDGLWQITMAGATTWLVLYAWSRTRLPAIIQNETVEHHEQISPMMVTSLQEVPQTNLPAPEKTRPARKTVQPSKRPAARMRGHKTVHSKNFVVNYLKGLNTRAAALIGQFHFPAIFNVGSGQLRRISPQPTRKAPKPAVKPVQHKSISRKPQPIRLVGLEEHRCPYCLELVEENDPAGVVVCPICHANHHKSCWDISGTCQVPHIQS
jgi:hypothetical protein